MGGGLCRFADAETKFVLSKLHILAAAGFAWAKFEQNPFATGLFYKKNQDGFGQEMLHSGRIAMVAAGTRPATGHFKPSRWTGARVDALSLTLVQLFGALARMPSPG